MSILLKIYDFKGLPNPTRVRLALAEKGLFDQVEFRHVDLPSGEHKTPAFLAKNPSGLVPVAELRDGTCISECMAITEYIDHIAGEPMLTGTSPKERGVIHMMQYKVEAGLLNAATAFFHHATDGLGRHVERYRNPSWGKHQRQSAIATLKWMDNALARHEFLAGERFTVADITAMAGVAFSKSIGIEFPHDCKNLYAWYDRVSRRQSADVAA